MTTATLLGKRILITRPQHQAGGLIRAIESLDGQAIPFPVLDILPRPPAEVRAEIAAQAPPDLLIFVSANAVEHAYACFQDASAQIAAIGPATARAVAAAGGTVDIVPEDGFDSGHLLGTPPLKRVDGKTVTIVRGQSGRELLAETLRHRGATVQYLTAYRRAVRTVSDAEVGRLQRRWETDEIDAIVVMSVATLDALTQILPTACQPYLRRTLLVAPSKRVIQTALERLPGVRCAQASGPTPEDIVEALADSLHNDSDHRHD